MNQEVVITVVNGFAHQDGQSPRHFPAVLGELLSQGYTLNLEKSVLNLELYARAVFEKRSGPDDGENLG